jgi:hypothetical protein
MVSQLKLDSIVMLIYSYVWTGEQALKKIREINHKSKEVVE